MDSFAENLQGLGMCCTAPFDLNLERPVYFAVGIANSAPLAIVASHRCMMLFCFV